MGDVLSEGDATTVLEAEALVVGGGLAGLYALYRLRKEGIDAKLIEASKQLGGVWNYNRYPGARVDTEVPYYQYSIPEVYKTWSWVERYPGQDELLRYFDHVATTLDLYDHITFQQNVIGSEFDIGSQQWNVRTQAGKTIRCKYLVAASGSSYIKHLPTFNGMDEYQGTLLHAADFPAKGYDFTGKRVAVIGQGATGVQVTQEVSKIAEKLTVFIRTPNNAIPMRQRKMSREEQIQYRTIYVHLFNAARNSRTGLPYVSDGKAVKEINKEEREARWEELWEAGGLHFIAAGYRDLLFDKESNDLLYQFWRKKTAPRISDQRKRDILVPAELPHPMGTKRTSLEQDYYECIDKANVEVVSLYETSIQSFDRTGITTSDDQHRDLDVIILATGYDSITGGLNAMGLRDIDGVDMRERWKDGVKTHLGMTVPGFPNMFMIYSPQAPTALANGVTVIEIQGDWIADTITKMKNEHIDTIDAEPAAAEKWASDIQEMNNMTLFPLANTWYMGDNIPGKKREQLNYLAGVNTYEEVCKEARKDWSGFKLGMAKS